MCVTTGCSDADGFQCEECSVVEPGGKDWIFLRACYHQRMYDAGQVIMKGIYMAWIFNLSQKAMLCDGYGKNIVKIHLIFVLSKFLVRNTKKM